MRKEFKRKYKYGFTTEVESQTFPKGLNLKVIEAIARKNGEPEFILEFRKRAFKRWREMKEPHLEGLYYEPIDYQDISYHSEPKEKSLENPKLVKDLSKLGISMKEQNVSTDIVFDSVSIGTTFKEQLEKIGVVLCSISEGIRKYPELFEKYLGVVVPYNDNFFAALNSSVFSDGSFVFVPKNVRCPIELSTYFRINQKDVGQFERTLIIAEENSYVSYLEGCTAPAYAKHQLHAAVVELIALEGAEIKYSTVQNWYPGDKKGVGGIFNFVTKRGLCRGKNSKISWTQVEVGAAISWKYPGCILEGENSKGEFYSVALTNGYMQTDTGTKMIHKGKNSSSTILSKSIALEHSSNTYRGLVRVFPKAKWSKSYSKCDSLLFGKKAATNTFPTIDVKNGSSTVSHEASASKVDEEKLFYMESRGIDKESAINMIVNGFCKEVVSKMPLEFALESAELLSLKLEGATG